MKVQIGTKRSQGRTGIIGALVLCGLALFWVGGCSPVGRPVVTKRAPLEASEYGKFILYRVGDGKVKTFKPTSDSGYGPHPIPYIVGETYLPSRDPFDQQVYNYLHKGDGSENPPTLFQDFYYRNYNFKWGGEESAQQQRGASDNPDAVVVGDQLKLYFTNQPFSLTPSSFASFSGEYFCDTDQIPDVPLLPSDANIKYIELNSFMTLGFKPNIMDGKTVVTVDDVDVLAFQVPRDNTIVHFRIVAHTLQLASHFSFVLSLIDTDRNTVLAQSHAGFDNYTFDDPEIGYNFPRANVPGVDAYYLKIENLNHDKFQPKSDCIGQPNKDFMYLLICESDMAPAAAPAAEHEAFIRRGDLQPAPIGNPKLDGGKTFEPDDLSTPIEDKFPDCDGIPNTGDEGDWGVNEICHAFEGSNGVQDGNMQYWEIDEKTNLDDGEYFTAKDTNVRSKGWEAPSVMVAPGNDLLWMWINAGDAIYQLQSLDGLEGLDWDLSNLLNDRPAVRAGQNGDPDSPVVSSGVYGYCDTPADNSDVQVVKLCPVKGKPDVGCKGYPNTIAVTNGEDGVLETPAQEDDVVAVGNTITITSGPDGIINTFFLPTHLHYGGTIDHVNGVDVFHPYYIASMLDLTVPAGGPANPDVKCGDSVPGASDQTAFLLGDDEWAPALTMTPAEYWRKHNCVFFQLGDDFNKCAMGIPDTEAIRPGGGGKLRTVEDLLLDDDQLCHDGDTVGICPGPNGKLDWDTIYQPLQGDDYLCIKQDPVLHTNEVAICPGHTVLETPIIDWFYPITDTTVGGPTSGDVCCDGSAPACCTDGSPFPCTTLLGLPTCCSQICPGDDHKLQSLYVLYFTDLSVFFLPSTQHYIFSKGDAFTDFDDEMCVIGGQIALCPGENKFFQSYPLNRHQPVKRYAEYEDLIAHFTGLPNDCYSLEVEVVQEHLSDVPEKIFTLYRNEGIMFDDEIQWDPSNQEYFISTGQNGINQTCLRPGDKQLIPHLRGKPNQPIILPGPNGELDTPALKDELVRIPFDGPDLLKIGAGADGIANSFPLGDDRMEIFLGTGQPDWPCVLAGGDGKADTTARGNDTQLFRPGEPGKSGEVTGFDAYQVGYPDVVREGDQLYLFFTGLGWAQVPPSHRGDAGSLGTLGECDRAGLDHLWGNRDVKYEAIWSTTSGPSKPDIYERTLVDRDGNPHYRFLHALDNNQGVLLAPRIGVATSTVQRIKDDPTDWDKHPKPVIDLGEVCKKASSFPIDIGMDLSGYTNAVNYNGAYSSDTLIYHEQSSGQPIFVMVFSGLWSTTPIADADRELADDISGVHESFKYNIGLARSLDGMKWDVAYDVGSLMVIGSAMDAMSSGFPIDKFQFRNPTLTPGQGDSYNMFFEQFMTIIGTQPGSVGDAQYGTDNTAWIGFGVRAGAANPSASCLDLAGSPSLEQQGSRQAVLGGIVIAVPILIGLGWRLLRRKSLLG